MNAPSRAWLFVLTLAGVTCGGNVVVDPPPHGTSSGGASVSSGAGASVTTGSTGSTGAGGSTSSGGGGAGGGCNPVVTPPEMSVMGCIPSTFCPQASDADTAMMVTLQLGFCDVATQACCGKSVVDQVLCGPVKQGGLCCYTVLFSTKECIDGG